MKRLFWEKVLVAGLTVALVFFVWLVAGQENTNSSGLATKAEVVSVVVDTVPVHFEGADIPKPDLISFDYLAKKLEVESEIILVMDMSEGVETILYDQGSDLPRPLASLTKIMTVITALEEASQNSDVLITLESIKQPGDHGLRDGMLISLETAAGFIMQTSSNDLSYAIQESVSSEITDLGRLRVLNTFTKKMNFYADKLGLKDTFFVDAVGLDVSENLSGSYGSAMDVSKMMFYLYTNYPTVAQISTKPASTYSFSGYDIQVENTNPILKNYPEIVFSKTGFTDLAGGNLALMAKMPNNRLVSIVLMGSTFEGRFKDAEEVIKALKLFYELNQGSIDYNTKEYGNIN